MNRASIFVGNLLVLALLTNVISSEQCLEGYIRYCGSNMNDECIDVNDVTGNCKCCPIGSVNVSSSTESTNSQPTQSAFAITSPSASSTTTRKLSNITSTISKSTTTSTNITPSNFTSTRTSTATSSTGEVSSSMKSQSTVATTTGTPSTLKALSPSTTSKTATSYTTSVSVSPGSSTSTSSASTSVSETSSIHVSLQTIFNEHKPTSNTTTSPTNTTVGPTCWCRCGDLKGFLYRPLSPSLQNMTPTEKEEALALAVTKLKRTLLLPTAKLSSSIRRKSSMQDPRPSSQALGVCIGIGILCIILGLIVAPDLCTVTAFLGEILKSKLSL